MPNKNQRKLAAILFADIAGYTALMQQDEPTARLGLELFRDTFTKEVLKQRGRIANFYGDGCLCLFDSSVEAVECALAVQHCFLKATPNLPVRIGIHNGEVFLDDSSAYGNSINIASRIESIGIPGSILLSERVKLDIQNQPNFSFTSLGKQKFKNVKQALHIFALTNSGLSIPDKTQLSGKLADSTSSRRNKLLLYSGLLALALGLFSLLYQFAFHSSVNTHSDNSISNQSIAVLPFTNLSDDPGQDYFSTGISHDILENLSRIHALKVIDFNSSKQYKQSKKSNPKIGQELGVAHLLVGNVQKAGKLVRIRATLVKAQANQQIWAKSYDFELHDIFRIQSEVSKSIAQELQTRLSNNEEVQLNKSPTTNLKVYEQYSKGRFHWQLRTPDSLKMALAFYEQSIALDSTFAQGYAGLAQTYVTLASNSIGNWVKHYQHAKRYAEKALSLDPEQADALATLGNYYSDYERDYESSIDYLLKAIQLNPKDATAHQWLAETLLTKGDIEAAREAIDIAKFLSPVYASIQLIDGQILLAEGKIDEAIQHFQQMRIVHPEYKPTTRALFYGYLLAQDFETARATFKDRSTFGKILYGLHYYRELRYLDSLQLLRDSMEVINQRVANDDFEDVFLTIDNSIHLLNGQTELYIEGVQKAFDKHYGGPGHFQYFPLPDSIWRQASWQQFMERNRFFARPRSHLKLLQ